MFCQFLAFTHWNLNEIRVKIVKWHKDRNLDPIESMKSPSENHNKWVHWFRNVIDKANVQKPWPGQGGIAKCGAKWRRKMNQRIRDKFTQAEKPWTCPKRKRKSDKGESDAHDRALNRDRNKRLYWKAKLKQTLPETDEAKRQTILDVLEDFETDASLKLRAFNNILQVLFKKSISKRVF